MVMVCEFGLASAGAVCPWLTSGNVAFSSDSDRNAEANSFMITFLVFVRLRSFCGFRTVLSFEIYQHYRCAVFAVISRMPKLASVVYAGDSRSYPFSWLVCSSHSLNHRGHALRIGHQLRRFSRDRARPVAVLL